MQTFRKGNRYRHLGQNDVVVTKAKANSKGSNIEVIDIDKKTGMLGEIRTVFISKSNYHEWLEVEMNRSQEILKSIDEASDAKSHVSDANELIKKAIDSLAGAQSNKFYHELENIKGRLSKLEKKL
jgi:hypothetical protein